jgi:MAPEG family
MHTRIVLYPIKFKDALWAVIIRSFVSKGEVLVHRVTDGGTNKNKREQQHDYDTTDPQSLPSSAMRDDFPSPAELKGAIQGTLLYLGVYVVILIPFQSGSKFFLLGKKKREAQQKDKKGDDHPGKVSFRAIKYYNSRDMLALAGDRSVGNFLEFAIVFLPLMWIHALFVDPTRSFTICAVYSAARVIYPVVFMYGLPAIFLSTTPGYLVIGYLFAQLVANV